MYHVGLCIITYHFTALSNVLQCYVISLYDIGMNRDFGVTRAITTTTTNASLSVLLLQSPLALRLVYENSDCTTIETLPIATYVHGYSDYQWLLWQMPSRCLWAVLLLLPIVNDTVWHYHYWYRCYCQSSYHYCYCCHYHHHYQTFDHQLTSIVAPTITITSTIGVWYDACTVAIELLSLPYQHFCDFSYCHY